MRRRSKKARRARYHRAQPKRSDTASSTSIKESHFLQLCVSVNQFSSDEEEEEEGYEEEEAKS